MAPVPASKRLYLPPRKGPEACAHHFLHRNHHNNHHLELDHYHQENKEYFQYP